MGGIFGFGAVGVVTGEVPFVAGVGGDFAARVDVAAPDFETRFFGDNEAFGRGIGPGMTAFGVLPVDIGATVGWIDS